MLIGLRYSEFVFFENPEEPVSEESSAPALSEKEALQGSPHWKDLGAVISYLSHSPWKAFLARFRGLPGSQEAFNRLGLIRSRIARMCLELDKTPEDVKGDVLRMAEDAQEVGQVLCEEKGIQDSDYQEILGELDSYQTTKNRGKIAFAEAKRRFDPLFALPKEMSVYGKAVEVNRRIREEGKFFFSPAHKQYLVGFHQVQRQVLNFQSLVQSVLDASKKTPRRERSSKQSRKERKKKNKSSRHR